MDKTYLETTNNPNQVAIATPNTPAVAQTPTFDFNAEVQKSLARAKAKESAVITADTLTPSSSPVIPPAVNDQTARNNAKSLLMGTTPSAEEVALANQPTRTETPETKRAKEILGLQSGQAQDVLNQNEVAGVTPARKAVNEVNKQLVNLEADYKNEVDNINKNPEGYSTRGLQGSLQDAETRYLDKKFRLNIDKIAATGDLDTALKTVEDYIKFKYEPLDNELKTLQTLYGLYQNDMTESEKLLAQQTYQQKQDELDFNRQKELIAYKERITGNNGGISVPSNYNGEFGATVDLVANTGTTNTQRGQISGLMKTFISNNDYGSAYALITQTAGQSLKGVAGTKFQEQVNSLGVLDSMQKAIQDYANAGGNTNIFKGEADKIQTKIGQLYTDPKYAALAVQLDTAFQNYRQTMTGAAFGPQESAEYASVIPAKGNSMDLNIQKINGAKAYLNSSVNSTLKSQFGEGALNIKDRAFLPNGGQPVTTNPTDPLGLF